MIFLQDQLFPHMLSIVCHKIGNARRITNKKKKKIVLNFQKILYILTINFQQQIN
jgi:hypothetical protein